MTLATIKTLVRNHCGLSFEGGREPLLAEGVKTRIVRRGLSSPEEYLGVLTRDGDEIRKLVSLITVNETYFLREAAHFRVLTERLVPELRSYRGEAAKVKIVSAGCSTGEEPYSIAIALHERFGPGFGSRFSIVGFDIDEEALAKARQGLYAEHSFRGVPERIRAAYFSADGARYRINEACRRAVTFIPDNVCGETHPAVLCDADVVFYRNVSIYFDAEIQQRIFRGLSGLLHDRGYLFLSSVETFCHNLGILSLVERDGVFLYSKGVEVQIEERRSHAASPARAEAGPARVPSRPPVAAAPRGVLVERSVEAPRQAFDRALLLAARKQYAPALQEVEKVIAQEPTFAAAYLLKTEIMINCQRLDEASAACRTAVALDRWSLEGQLFLGLIAKIREDLPAAAERFKEALYIQPACWVAHFLLGEIRRCEGDFARAAREYTLVIEILGEKDSAAHGLRFFAFSFSNEQIVHLCRHNLDAMQRQGS